MKQRLELRDGFPEIAHEVSTPPPVARDRRPRRAFYVSVGTKFVISMMVAVAWFSFSLGMAQPWLADLASVVGRFPAFVTILFIALLPGFLNAHIVCSVMLDSPPPLRTDIRFPPISILIAAYNEAENLAETFRSIQQQDYPGEVEVILVDDGSTDNTLEVLQSLNVPNLRIVEANHGGKAAALNEGLKHVTNSVMVCIDADTFLHSEAVKRIVARLVTDPTGTAAVAGCVLVKNSRASFLARMQEWDYFTGIASAKRQQSLYQGTLVAQGAFSAFRTRDVRVLQGWPDVIGEDIVLTWALLNNDRRIGFEPTAIGFTSAPTDLYGFLRQRKRWARGMIEGLKRYGRIAFQGTLAGFFVGVDFIIPVLDFFYSFAFLPGIVLALTGRFYIVGPLTLFVLPLAFLIVFLMYRKQKRIFDEVGLKVRRNFAGFFVYMLVYQALMSPVCVAGYFQEVVGMRRRW